MSAQELCEVVRIAYDPPAALIIDEAHAAGTPVSLTWGEVGPTATQASWDDYRHDSAFSASWTMTGAPARIRELLRPLPAAGPARGH